MVPGRRSLLPAPPSGVPAIWRVRQTKPAGELRRGFFIGYVPQRKVGCQGMANPQRALRDAAAPATLHGVIRTAIARDLKEHYPVPQKMPHQMLVLLMQMNEDNKKKCA
jgi:hypothetical protein